VCQQSPAPLQTIAADAAEGLANPNSGYDGGQSQFYLVAHLALLLRQRQ
jgi:hypothetical protein